jgi:pimeloyl-ACP methyl ester carboxylesterase
MLDKLVALLIRPDRHLYSMADLGPYRFILKSKSIIVTRYDFIVKNARGLSILGSLFEQAKGLPMLVFLHCNGGSRVEGLSYLKEVMTAGYNYCVFDFAGSGLSDGSYVSLGFWEAQDIQPVVDWVQRGRPPQVYLWGKSMGAVACLLYLSAGGHADGVILDSPFSSAVSLIKELAWKELTFPEFLTTAILYMLKERIMEKAQFSLDDLDLLARVPGIQTPALFLTSRSDELVKSDHIVQLQQHYGGYSEIRFIGEEHAKTRDKRTLNIIWQFLLELDRKSSPVKVKLDIPLVRQEFRIPVRSDRHSLKQLRPVDRFGYRDRLDAKSERMGEQIVNWKNKLAEGLVTSDLELGNRH